MSHSVPRAGRLLDAAGLLLFLAGAGCYARAYLGMEELKSFRPDPAGPAFAAMARFDQFWRLSRLGVGLMIGGVTILVVGTLAVRWIGRRNRS